MSLWGVDHRHEILELYEAEANTLVLDCLEKLDFQIEATVDSLHRALGEGSRIVICHGVDFAADPYPIDVNSEYHKKYLHLGYLDYDDGVYSSYSLVIPRQNPPTLRLVFTRAREDNGDYEQNFFLHQRPDQRDEYLVTTPLAEFVEQCRPPISFYPSECILDNITLVDGSPVDDLKFLRFDESYQSKIDHQKPFNSNRVNTTTQTNSGA